LSGTLIIIRKPKVWRTDGRTDGWTWRSLYTPDSRRAGVSKSMVKPVIYMLFSYQTGYIMWHLPLMI